MNQQIKNKNTLVCLLFLAFFTRSIQEWEKHILLRKKSHKV